MNKENVESIYPLAPMQESMLFHSIDGKESKVYVVVLHFSLHGTLNVSAFKHAWQQVLDRHPVLRTFFIWKNRETPLQIVRNRVELPWQDHDWRHMPASKQTEQLKSFLQADREKGFNLSKAPLMRFSLVQMTENDYHFIFSHHHMLLDGWSMGLLLKEVFAVYQAICSSENISLEKLQPYQTYISWLKQQDLSEAELYWRKTLQGFTQPTPIYVDETLGDSQSAIEVYDEQQFRLPRATTAKLQSLAQQHKITLSTLIHGVWAVLLNRYSGETDIVFGTVVSGRSIALTGIESMIGLFINTLPVRVQIPPQASLVPWLKELQGQLIQARQFEHSSLRNIQAWSELVRSQGQSLFDSILVIGNYPLNDFLKDAVGGLEIGDVSFLEGSNYPLAVLIDPNEEFTIRMNYDTRRYSDATIVQIFKHFQTLLEAFAANPYQPLSAFSPLTAEETKKLLEELNQTTVSYPNDKTLMQLFEIQVAKTPDNVAVQHGQDFLTYAQLNRRANQIAHYLGQFELGSPGLVCLYLARSCDMIAAILGVLKAGGAYVPLDPIYPPARLALLLDDIAQATSRGKPIVITQPELADNLPLNAVNSVCLGNDQAKISQCLDTNPLPSKTAQDIAYVLYTSGSTGVPKGVCCHHRGVINLLSDFQRRQDIRPGDSCSWWTSISFDVSVYEIFSALLYGAKLYIVPEEIRADRDSFIAWISKHRIQNAYVPPSMVGKLAAESERPSFALELRRLLVGVEPISEPLLATICRNVPGCRIINGYGPTEATVCATLYDVIASQTPKRNTPIGRPVQNMQIYLLDRSGQIVPFGVPGEIHIGGVGVAQGYLNRPNLTAERFIADPFNPKSQARLYKTGDIARYLPDGNIQFIGRTDFQIKFRGYRIEPGEIEAALRQHPAVRDTAVIVREDEPNNQRLVGYIVPSENQTVDKHGLRRYLNQKLPPYMVPNVFVLLDAIPLTPSDKVDRKRLPKPSTNDTMHGTEDYIAPRSPSEQIIAAIWADVFGLSQVSIEANFFDLGGDSILSIRVMMRLSQAFQIEFAPVALFEMPTVADLAGYIEDRLVAEIANLSDEEAERLLANLG